MSKYRETTVFQLWNDSTGERVELGADSDGMGLLEIRAIAFDGVKTQTLTLTDVQATWLAKKLTAHCERV